MNVTGLIVEYNPLHNGHSYHFTEAKRLSNSDATIAVMSGNFLQRGEPAIVDKWARTEMALHQGVDLVLELPVAYAVGPAEWFAYGATALLEATGITTHLCFGSEAGNLATLETLAEHLADESDTMKAAIAKHLATGMNYPSAYAAAGEDLLSSTGLATTDYSIGQLLSQPNNSLGLHYLIALRRLGSGMTPVTVQRKHANYNDESPRHETIASATALRKLIHNEGIHAVRAYVPETTAAILEREFQKGYGPVTWESFAQPLFHRLLSSSAQQLARHHEMTEGLEHRILKALYELDELTVDSLLQKIKTKRYTLTKLQRTLLHVLLQNEQDLLNRQSLGEGPQYLRVLGFNDQGRTLLKMMKKRATLPIVTRAAGLSHPQLSLDLRASAVYANGMQTRERDMLFRDYHQPPIML